jgi:hypothetical protein
MAPAVTTPGLRTRVPPIRESASNRQAFEAPGGRIPGEEDLGP